VLPWSQFWERNYFVQAWPVLRPFITNAFVRGAVTGLGIVNVLAGVADLVPIFSGRGPRFEPQADSRIEP
jgi:hypothetical protein